MNFKSPLCSCIICHETKSAKGIFSHFITKHTDNGNERCRKNGLVFKEKSDLTKLSKKQTKVDLYKLNPSICISCNEPLLYEKRKNKFCSKSCAVIFNNQQRSPMPLEVKNKISNSVTINGYKHPKGSNGRPPFTKISFCVVCSELIKFSNNKTCSKECNKLQQSERMKSKLRTGKNYSKRKFHTSPFAGRVFLESSWEIKLAESLDSNKISWIRPKYLNYTIDNKRRSYYPDFYLPDYDVFIDPKNKFQQNQDKEKINAVIKEHGIKLLVITEEHCSWDRLKTLL